MMAGLLKVEANDATAFPAITRVGPGRCEQNSTLVEDFREQLHLIGRQPGRTLKILGLLMRGTCILLGCIKVW